MTTTMHRRWLESLHSDQQRLAQPDVIALTPHQPCRRQTAMDVDDVQQSIVPGQVEEDELEDWAGQL